jgi:hypothetical protein
LTAEPASVDSRLKQYGQFRMNSSFPDSNCCRPCSSWNVIACWGMLPSLNAATSRLRPLFACEVFTSAVLPSLLTISPPSVLIASATLTVRPSYLANWPA